jgi:hypothetical protein
MALNMSSVNDGTTLANSNNEGRNLERKVAAGMGPIKKGEISVPSC